MDKLQRMLIMDPLYFLGCASESKLTDSEEKLFLRTCEEMKKISETRKVCIVKSGRMGLRTLDRMLSGGFKRDEMIVYNSFKKTSDMPFEETKICMTFPKKRKPITSEFSFITFSKSMF